MTVKKNHNTTYTLNMSDQLFTDIAVIREKVERMEKVLEKAVCDSDGVEKRVTIMEQRVGVFAGIQGVFTVIVGAVAAYFGGNK